MKPSFKYICSFLAVFSVKYITCDSLPCDFIDSVNITDGVRDGLGNIIHNNILYKPKYYRTIDYDYEHFSEKKFVANYIRGCPCAVRLCVRMCCPQGHVFHRRKCVPSDGGLEVRVNTTLYNSQRSFEVVDLVQNPTYGFLYGKPCEFVYELDPAADAADEWSFARNGSIIYDTKLLTRNQYCFMQTNDSEPVVPFVCFEPEEDFKYALYPIGMLLSVPFLLVTFSVYACIPELRNMHGKSLMCYVFGLAVGYTVLSLVQMRIFEGDTTPCKVTGYMVYFSFMVSFFWLNVMSFDIYWTFSGVRGAKSTERKKFALYSLYAWGCPVLIVTLALVMDHTELVPVNFRPQVGVKRCLLQEDKYVEFMYLYLPMLLLVFANVIFFVITAIRIIKIQRETSMIRRGDSKRHSKLDNDRDRFSLYLRLFIVMGVTWSLEVISWAVDNVAWIFYISDVCNCIQGFLIFMLFVWKQKVKRLIYKKFGIPLGDQEPSLSTCSTRTTATVITSSFNGSRSEKPLVTRLTSVDHSGMRTPSIQSETAAKQLKAHQFG
ncbi:G-protein coupled receptor Mth2-like isoform X1 [Wyeomyia smithii]|uniref:G-protein coupled receptor Mth2-like isoform X1 n=1 Tax=Wyeomyia smithii TaxID=174621 RepID=UPI0024681323|nr:G-protein coupled receptor Mth2-like isoform X1 [Wyeomyia smithii]XP_055537394.1 G-protein coupled receptor Mth2-like isoform X1 [Wyeomyia smithii]XP_055537395.1 G-protein coupled receptor Mth2-like isoform X1 [Wyeomyia smithii]